MEVPEDVQRIREALITHQEFQARVISEENEGEEFMAAWTVINDSIGNQWALLRYIEKLEEVGEQMRGNLQALERKRRETHARYKKLTRDLRRQRDRLLKRIEKLEERVA